MLVYGVVIESFGEAVELFPTRAEAEHVVAAWDLDEPDRAGELRIEEIELESVSTN